MRYACPSPHGRSRLSIDPAAFEMYRQTPSGRTGLPRLLAGSAIVAAFWMAGTVAALMGGSYVHAHWLAASGAGLPAGGIAQDFIATPAGVLTALASFAGIWIGVWVAMRLVHREPLAALLGNARRVSWNGFAKGLAAVAITSLLSEVALYMLSPGIGRGTISLSSWLVFLVPIVLLTLLQTSSEELLFRGYLTRGLAARFRSPLVWGLLPLLLFTSMHWSPASGLAINLSVLVSIFAFALVLLATVYATGNLGAAFGAHLANNLFGFLLISHQESYDAFALFTAPALEAAGWTGSDALFIAAIGIAASGLTALLLLHPRSPLRVEPDLGRRPVPGGSASPA